MIFVFEFVYTVDYIDGFPCIKPSLHPWNETYLVRMDDCFLDYFCIDIHNGNWSEVFHLFGSFCGLGIRVIMASYNELGRIPSVSILWNSLRRVEIRCSLKV